MSNESQNVVAFSFFPYNPEYEGGGAPDSRRFIETVDNMDGTFTFHDSGKTAVCNPNNPEEVDLQTDCIVVADAVLPTLSKYLKEKGVEEEDQYLSYSAETQTFTVLDKADVENFLSL